MQVTTPDANILLATMEQRMTSLMKKENEDLKEKVAFLGYYVEKIKTGDMGAFKNIIGKKNKAAGKQLKEEDLRREIEIEL